MNLLIRLWVIFLLTVSFCQAQKLTPNSAGYDSLKAAGKVSQPAQAARQANYPILQDARKRTVTTKQADVAGRMSLQAATATTQACSIEDPRNDPQFAVLPANDDGFTEESVPLQFTFSFFGSTYTQVYVNNNGNITFNESNGIYSSTGFPSIYDMIAPFWADVDTRGSNSGLVYYKSEPTRFTVIWYRVGYYNTMDDKLNTFKLIITDGTDTSIGLGNNVAFVYGDMQWTTGSASEGVDGFGGIPASVGMDNSGSGSFCFYYQLGRFSKPGTEFVSAYDSSGVDYLDYKCFFYDASVIDPVSFDFNYNKLICAIEFVPTINNPQGCRILDHWWNFGDGDTTHVWNAIHSYSNPGTYTASLYVNYSCGICGEQSSVTQKQIVVNASDDALIDTLVYVTTQVKQQVLSTTASTFSDVWPLQQVVPGLNTTNGFLNGTQGVWRNDGAYVYEVPRKLSPNPNLKTDGTFTLDYFNWEDAAVQAIPNWIKTNTVTRYSPYSYEIENQDVLGVYTGALYDYGGHLPSANGVNMRNDEMAFTSFEYLDGKSSGNWIFGNQPLPQYYIYPTLLSYKNIAVVRASTREFENVDKVDVTARSLFIFGHRTNTITNDDIICVRSYPSNPDWSLIVLSKAPSPWLWIGDIKVNNEIQPIISPDIDLAFAHTGRSSLKITAEKTFKQEIVRLDSGKSYMISAWVSVNNPSVATPKLADNLGFDVLVRDRQDALISTFSFSPAGRVIEGWQQVKGVFTCPAKGTYIELKFKPGSTGTAWYDDLRLHPEKGNMRSYVYDLNDYRLRAILDEENFASLFFYDQEGNLYLTQKETEEGIKTISENVSYQVETQN